ncbi:hypothetical protein A1O1_06369 [Capronia coronata CBS 617.96]|uniref:Xylanolytic transcriptional activator regulatory domain-containing protein n=1 Tax=Capronia coronata CBS 617.96 TaxID=1182541 RepID=W9Y8P3_9EURO|nr:uncharacterized protein A1O1_06369 [Capronia coronata CBS 617.96]EXJ86000.1 hypothetical protein A1O1_06369 [Capronia coronata CBS 617.96]
MEQERASQTPRVVSAGVSPASLDGTSRENQDSVPPAEPGLVDGLVMVSPGDTREVLYGNSSTISFIQRLSKTKGGGQPQSSSSENEAVPSDHLVDTNTPMTQSTPEIIRDQDPRAFVYPSRPMADNFVLCFWDFVHPVFPVIHKTSFMEKYERLWVPQNASSSNSATAHNDELVFSATLNLVFALGCQYSDLVMSAEKTTMGDEFYQRSRKIIVFDVMDSTSLGVVQLLLLTGVYLQSTTHANRCWNTIGLAIRVAQSLGLHLDRPMRVNENQLGREMRRRIWNVQTPLLIDDDYLQVDGEGTQPSSHPSYMGLSVYSSKLFEILNDILNIFYIEDCQRFPSQDGDANSFTKMLSDVMNLNNRLDVFIASVPDYLQPTSASVSGVNEENKHVSLQSKVLYCRYVRSK